MLGLTIAIGCVLYSMQGSHMVKDCSYELMSFPATAASTRLWCLSPNSDSYWYIQTGHTIEDDTLRDTEIQGAITYRGGG